MIKFLKHTLIFLTILFVISFSTQWLADKGLRKSNYCSINNYFSNYKEWYDIFDSRINSDIIIQGSSRAWVHVSPKQLETNLNLTAYNLGIDGHDFVMEYYRYKIYEKYCKKQPKYIIQVEGLSGHKPNNLYMSEQFIPYLKEPYIKEAMTHYNAFDYKDYYIPLFKYTHNKDLALFGLRNVLNKDVIDNGKYKGFYEWHKTWDSSFADFKRKNPLGVKEKIDPLIYRLYEDFLSNNKKKNIKTIIVYTPQYIESQKLVLNKDSIIEVYNKLSVKYNIPFLDYSKDSMCYQKKYFYNSQHMNSEGVKLFNTRLIEDLKGIIDK